MIYGPDAVLLMYHDDHESNTLGLQKHADYVQLVLALFYFPCNTNVGRFVLGEVEFVIPRYTTGEMITS